MSENVGMPKIHVVCHNNPKTTLEMNKNIEHNEELFSAQYEESRKSDNTFKTKVVDPFVRAAKGLPKAYNGAVKVVKSIGNDENAKQYVEGFVDMGAGIMDVPCGLVEGVTSYVPEVLHKGVSEACGWLAFKTGSKKAHGEDKMMYNKGTFTNEDLQRLNAGFTMKDLEMCNANFNKK